jgi:hypothetical protein
MRKMAATVVSAIFALALSSCGGPDYRHEIKVPGMKGRIFLSKANKATPLTDDDDRVDYEFGSKKLRLFTGSGGKSLGLTFDKSRNLLIIAYCGGRIEGVESSFSDVVSTDADDHWTLYRTQVINNPGFAYHGVTMCG